MSNPNTPGQPGAYPQNPNAVDPANAAPGWGPAPAYGQPQAPVGDAAHYQPTQYAQTAYPGYGPPAPQQAWGAPGGGGHLPPQPPKNTKKTVLWLVIAAAIVVVLLVIALVVVLTRDKGPGGTPKAAVQTYLEGLANGDAKKALGVMRTPPSDKLLNDNVLKQQQAIAHITDINVRDAENQYGDNAQVKATYKFGDRNADIDVRLTKSSDGWQVEDGAIPITLDYQKVPQLTLFGVDVAQDSKVYLFPGPQSWGSKNQYLAPKQQGDSDFPLGPASYSSVILQTGLSTKGEATVKSAVDTYLTNCATSTQTRAATDRPGCGQAIYQDAPAGSVRWIKPADLSDVEYRVDYTTPSKVSVSGYVQWSATYPGGTDTDRDYLYGAVDLTAATPVFTPNG